MDKQMVGYEQLYLVFTFKRLKKHKALKTVSGFVPQKNEFMTFVPPRTCSSGKWLFLLCKGLWAQISPWLCWFW